MFFHAWRYHRAWWHRIRRRRGCLGVTQPRSPHAIYLSWHLIAPVPWSRVSSSGSGGFLVHVGPLLHRPRRARTHADILRTTPRSAHALDQRPLRARARTSPAPRTCSISAPNQPRSVCKHPQTPASLSANFTSSNIPCSNADIMSNFLSLSAHGPVRRGRKRRESLRGEQEQPNQDGAEPPVRPLFDSARCMPYRTRRT